MEDESRCLARRKESQYQYLSLKPIMMGAYLMIGEHKSVSDNEVFAACGCENNHLCNVIWCKRLAATAMAKLSVRDSFVIEKKV